MFFEYVLKRQAIQLNWGEDSHISEMKRQSCHSFCKANTRYLSWQLCRFCHLITLALFDTTSQALGGRTELRWAPHSGNLTPPRISPSCPHCLRLWLGRGTIIGGQGHCETACQCCFGMDGYRSLPCWPSLMQPLGCTGGSWRILRIAFPLSRLIR